MVHKGRGGGLDDQQKRYILWALSEHRGEALIAADLGLGRSTVWAHKRAAFNDPAVFVEVGYIAAVDLGTTRRDRHYFCRHCAALMKDPATAADHGFVHVFGEEPLQPLPGPA